ncbi:hypothetical protein GCM10009664_40830 [Kitasatospora gansuensis]
MVQLVRGGVLVNLDDDDLRVVQVLLDPVGVDQDVTAAHGGVSIRGRYCGRGYEVPGTGRPGILSEYRDSTGVARIELESGAPRRSKA